MIWRIFFSELYAIQKNILLTLIINAIVLLFIIILKLIIKCLTITINKVALISFSNLFYIQFYNSINSFKIYAYISSKIYAHNKFIIWKGHFLILVLGFKLPFDLKMNILIAFYKKIFCYRKITANNIGNQSHKYYLYDNSDHW